MTRTRVYSGVGRIFAGRIALLLFFLVILLMAAGPASANQVVVNWNGGTGNWSDATQWTPAGVPNNAGGTTYTVNIGGGGFVTMDLMNATVDSVHVSQTTLEVGTLDIGAGSALSLASGESTNGSMILIDGKLDNFATLHNYLEIDNGGLLLNNGGAILINDNFLYQSGSGVLENLGTFNTSGNGVLNLGTVNNSGTLNNSPSCGTCTFANYGTLSNSGTINNSGNLGNASTYGTNGVLNNSGSIYNSGTLTNASLATLNNFGTIENDSGGTITNYWNIYNSGTINNDSGATFGNSGVLYNNPSGELNNSGRISGPGALNNSGTINLIGTGATLGAGALTNSGTITLSGLNSTLTADLTNTGTITLNGNGDLLAVTGDFNNNSGGSLVLEGASFNVGLPPNSVTVSGNFNNAFGASITMTGEVGSISVAGDMNNGGAVTLGMLPGAVGNSLNVGGNFNNNGAVTLGFNSGNSLSVGGDFNNSSAGSLEIVGPNGASVNGAFNNDGSVVVIGISGVASLSVGGNFLNNGSITLDGEATGAYLGVGSNFYNRGTFSFAGGAQGSHAIASVGGNFYNDGWIEIGHTNFSQVLVGGSFNNSSTVDVIPGGRLNTGGDFNNNSGSSLNLVGGGIGEGASVNVTGNFNNAAGASLTTDGMVTRTLVNGNFNNSGSVSLSAVADSLEVSGNFNNATGASVTAAGITGPVTISVGGDLNNSGVVTYLGRDDFSQLQVGGNFNNNNGGVLNLMVGGTSVPFANTNVNVSGNFNNAFGASLTTDGITGLVAISVARDFINSGSVSLTGVADSLTVSGNYNNAAGITSIQSGGMISATNFNITGGSVQGTGTIASAVNAMGGVVLPGMPGAPGTLSINGSFTQGPGGMLVIDLAGVNPGEFGVLSVNGPAIFSGTVDFTAVNGFTPGIGDTFTFLFGSLLTGNFANMAFTNWLCPSNATCTDVFGANSITLQINPSGPAPTPEPGSLLLLGTGLLGVGGIARKKLSRAR